MKTSLAALAKITQNHPGLVLEKVGAYEVIDCQLCGYAHVRPMPTLKELKKLYAEKFYGEDKKNYFERMEADVEWWNMVYEGRYETIEKLLANSNGRRILDVGSSGGFFLSAGQSRGWKTQGVELGRQAVEYARKKGLSILQADIHDADLSKIGPFDAIYCSFVLEHLPDPAPVLRKLHEALIPGGVFCVEVPNDFNPFQAIVRNALKSAPYWVAPDHHLNYFTPESLRRLFEKAGFECGEMEGTFPMELFLLMGDNYIGNDPVGRQLHGKRKRFEILLHQNGMEDFKRELYRFCIGRQVGREIVLYGIRR